MFMLWGMGILQTFFSYHVKTVVHIVQMSKSNEQIFYAVGVGRKTGIYHTWNECKSQVDGVRNPKFRKFYSLSEAKEFIKHWENKQTSPNKVTNDEILCLSPRASDVNTIQKGYSKASNSERVQTDDFGNCKKNNENKSLDVKSLQVKLSNCEKKIDCYMNSLRTIISGLDEIKNDFGQISDICKSYFESEKGELSKAHDSKPGSSNEKSGYDYDDGDLFEDTSDAYNDCISQGITIEDFDFSDNGFCETSGKRKRSRSDEDTGENESNKKNKKVSSAKSVKHSVHFTKDKDDYVAVYTDGCCLGNGYSGAKAGIGIWFGEDHPLNVSKPLRGVVPSNNNAEIQAARIAIEIALKENISKLKIITDSQFLINCATKWIPKWKLNNWIAAKNKRVVNRIELEKLDKVMSLLSVRWEKVPGHQGIRGNDAADMLANKGAALYNA